MADKELRWMRAIFMNAYQLGRATSIGNAVAFEETLGIFAVWGLTRDELSAARNWCSEQIATAKPKEDFVNGD